MIYLILQDNRYQNNTDKATNNFKNNNIYSY